jgi:hypothetical protein
VVFGLVITDVSGSGFSRTVTAEISNSGHADAHNVRGEVFVSSGDSSIKVNGQSSIKIDVGLLPAGQTVIKRVTMSFSFTDGLKVAQNGATIKLVVYSDELTDTLYYDYTP